MTVLYCFTLQIHRACQYIGVILSTGAFITALLMVQVGHFLAMPHALFGAIGENCK